MIKQEERTLDNSGQVLGRGTQAFGIPIAAFSSGSHQRDPF
jgi:hypothetical protein